MFGIILKLTLYKIVFKVNSTSHKRGVKCIHFFRKFYPQNIDLCIEGVPFTICHGSYDKTWTFFVQNIMFSFKYELLRMIAREKFTGLSPEIIMEKFCCKIWLMHMVLRFCNK